MSFKSKILSLVFTAWTFNAISGESLPIAEFDPMRGLLFTHKFNDFQNPDLSEDRAYKVNQRVLEKNYFLSQYFAKTSGQLFVLTGGTSIKEWYINAFPSIRENLSRVHFFDATGQPSTEFLQDPDGWLPDALFPHGWSRDRTPIYVRDTQGTLSLVDHVYNFFMDPLHDSISGRPPTSNYAIGNHWGRILSEELNIPRVTSDYRMELGNFTTNGEGLCARMKRVGFTPNDTEPSLMTEAGCHRIIEVPTLPRTTDHIDMVATFSSNDTVFVSEFVNDRLRLHSKAIFCSKVNGDRSCDEIDLVASGASEEMEREEAMAYVRQFLHHRFPGSSFKNRNPLFRPSRMFRVTSSGEQVELDYGLRGFPEPNLIDFFVVFEIDGYRTPSIPEYSASVIQKFEQEGLKVKRLIAPPPEIFVTIEKDENNVVSVGTKDIDYPTYANSIFFNEKVFVPQYSGFETYNRFALEAYAEDGFEVVPIPYTMSSYFLGGSLHCTFGHLPK